MKKRIIGLLMLPISATWAQEPFPACIQQLDEKYRETYSVLHSNLAVAQKVLDQKKEPFENTAALVRFVAGIWLSISEIKDRIDTAGILLYFKPAAPGPFNNYNTDGQGDISANYQLLLLEIKSRLLQWDHDAENIDELLFPFAKKRLTQCLYEWEAAKLCQLIVLLQLIYEQAACSWGALQWACTDLQLMWNFATRHPPSNRPDNSIAQLGIIAACTGVHLNRAMFNEAYPD